MSLSSFFPPPRPSPRAGEPLVRTVSRHRLILSLLFHAGDDSDPPRTADALRKNPLGIYINGLAWSPVPRRSVTSRSLPSGLGDLISAFVFWLVFGGRSLGDLPLLLMVATAAGIVLVATVVVIQCLAFWVPDAAAFCEDLFNLFLMVAFYPQHPFSFTVRVILFTLIPTGFISFLPVEAVRDEDPLKALAMVGAAACYGAIAVAVFERGLRRYSSGNRILILR